MKITLTDRTIKAAKPKGLAVYISDAVVPALALRVMPTGAKSFVLVARFPGSNNPTRRSLGAYGAVSLQEARDKARGWLELLGRGIDPATEVERERNENLRRQGTTVAAVIEDYIRRKVIGHNPERPNFRSAARVILHLRNAVVPLFGHRPVTELTSREVSIALEAIAQFGTDHGMVKLGARKQLHRPGRACRRSPEQARYLFIHLDQALRWAAGTGDYGLDMSPLQRVKKEDRFGPLNRRDRVLTDDELGELWRGAGRMNTPYRQLYRMLALTGLRLAEVREASWDEIDPKAKVWTIPAERMKGKHKTAREHRVPLTPHMLAVLKEVPRGPRGPFVFSVNLGASAVSAGGKFKEALDGYLPPGKHFTNHDIRRTVRTRGRKLGIAEDVGEAMLAHRRPGIIGTYDADDRFDERREAHELWGEFLIGLGGRPSKVVNMKGRAA